MLHFMYVQCHVGMLIFNYSQTLNFYGIGIAIYYINFVTFILADYFRRELVSYRLSALIFVYYFFLPPSDAKSHNMPHPMHTPSTT